MEFALELLGHWIKSSPSKTLNKNHSCQNWLWSAPSFSEVGWEMKISTWWRAIGFSSPLPPLYQLWETWLQPPGVGKRFFSSVLQTTAETGSSIWNSSEGMKSWKGDTLVPRCGYSESRPVGLHASCGVPIVPPLSLTSLTKIMSQAKKAKPRECPPLPILRPISLDFNFYAKIARPKKTGTWNHNREALSSTPRSVSLPWDVGAYVHLSMLIQY